MNLIKIFVAFLVFISLFSMSISALSLDMKESYQPRETMIVEITGNILSPINLEDIEFKRKNVIVPLNYDVKVLGERHFIWAVAPLNESNYTLVLKKVDTTVNGVREETSYEKNFSIYGNITSYSVTPGFILTNKENFTVEVFLYEDEKKVVSIDFPEVHEVTLRPGKNELKFKVDSVFGSVFREIHLGYYTLPAYISGTARNKYEAQDKHLAFEPATFYKEIEIDRTVEYTIIIRNRYNETIEDISLNYNEDLFTITEDSRFALDPGESREFIVKTNDPVKEDLREFIYARSDDIEITMPIEILIKRIDEQTGENLLYCEEIPGMICTESEECVGESENSIQGACCLGICEKKETESGSKGLIGWFLAGIIIIGLVVMFFKYRKSNAPIEEKK